MAFKVQHFRVEVTFISCEFNIPDVIAFYAFLRQLKNHYPGGGGIVLFTISISTNIMGFELGGRKLYLYGRVSPQLI